MRSKKIESLLSGEDFGVLSDIASKCGVGSFIADVGCYKGGSTFTFASKSLGTVYSIDIWDNEKTLCEFLDNLKRFIRAGVIIPIVTASHIAVQLFPDNFFDCVFLDADHRYSSIKRDLDLWIPKVKSGGIICGHDAECKYTDYPPYQQQEINDNLEVDKTSFTCHAGVVKALYDVFNDNYDIVKDSTVWVKSVL